MNNQKSIDPTIHMQVLHAGILQFIHMIHNIHTMQINIIDITINITNNLCNENENTIMAIKHDKSH